MRRGSRRTPAGLGFLLLLLSACGGGGDEAGRAPCRPHRAGATTRRPGLPVPYPPPGFAGRPVPDVVAFLCTLTDGYDPNSPAAYQVPTQCLPALCSALDLP